MGFRVQGHGVDDAGPGGHPHFGDSALQGRAGGAGAGDEPVPAPHHDFRIGPHVHHEGRGFPPVQIGVEDARQQIPAEIGADVGKQKCLGMGVEGQAQAICGLGVGDVHAGDIGFPDDFPGGQSHEEMGHGRVPRPGKEVDIRGGVARLAAQGRQGLVHPGDGLVPEFLQAAGLAGMVDSGQDIGADAGLGIVHALLGQRLARGKVHQGQDNAGGADVHGRPQHRRVIPRGEELDQAMGATVLEYQCPAGKIPLPKLLGQGLNQLPGDVDVITSHGPFQGLFQALGIGQVVSQYGLAQGEVVEPSPERPCPAGRGHVHHDRNPSRRALTLGK